MRVLFISGELIAGDIAYRLKNEGCDVKLYIKDKSRKDCLDGIVTKTEEWKSELNWVGKDGLILFDDVGYGKEQDRLRAQGYNVVGGSEGGDMLEKEREMAQVIMSLYGINTLKTFKFRSIKEAVNFIKNDRTSWVIKQNDHKSTLNYVGAMEDGSDVISLLETYESQLGNNNSLSIQKKVVGIEIGVARYFNGKAWASPIEINIEHKALFNGGIGPLTGEMGTLMWYDDNENNKLFKATLAKMEPYLKKINFKGDIDINCIVNKAEVYPLEITSRLGCPSTQLQAEIHLSPWKDFLMSLAKGKEYELDYKRGYGIIVSVSIPPFPYKNISNKYYAKGVEIIFKENLTDDEFGRLHFEEVSMKTDNGRRSFHIAGSNGFCLYVTGFGESVQNARQEAYDLVHKIVIPKMFYRTDIGTQFMEKDHQLLKEWGWI